MPSPKDIVALFKAQGIQHVRLYNADQSMLIALANIGIRVTVSVPNDQLLGIGQSNAIAKAKFGAEVAKESARSEKIVKKSLKAKSRAYAYAPKEPMRTHCHDLGVTS
ncbi:hypothetical protein PIB30_059393 [Stylosanthes scabra]|uniref:glucan endo-1,3-beta-D-glucosidase n=1 Tax=Stylosanthes scabra TaxID=79078 RepID=A0ABU6UK38_9FABA|nr:hypothetical protein [Stylosanthes scabra]